MQGDHNAVYGVSLLMGHLFALSKSRDMWTSDVKEDTHRRKATSLHSKRKKKNKETRSNNKTRPPFFCFFLFFFVFCFYMFFCFLYVLGNMGPSIAALSLSYDLIQFSLV